MSAMAVAYCFFRGVEHPVGQRQMGGRGGPRNYYAITHKPIDLDWTPGGRAARSWARFDLLQDHARGFESCSIWRVP